MSALSLLVVRVPILAWVLVYAARSGLAEDWPTWRHDPGRSASAQQSLPDELHLLWTRELPPLTPAWPDQEDRMTFDAGYEPIVAGKLLYLGSSCSDSVTAFDTETGEAKWVFFTDGPVRFAPAVANGLLFVASDDGCLYALDAVSGALRWKQRGFPSARKVLGNGRLISPWPARGGPAVTDGKVYFAAGIWPFMGVSIQALDAATGKRLWLNDEQASTFMLQPHNSPAFAGLAPQGYLAVSGDRVMVPGGRSIPGGFDRATGKMLYYRLAEFGKSGNASVAAQGGVFYNAGYAFAQDDGERIDKVGLGASLPILTDDTLFFVDKGGKDLHALAFKPAEIRVGEKKSLDRKTGRPVVAKRKESASSERWSFPADRQDLYLRAGSRLYLGGKDVVSAVSLPEGGGKPATVWRNRIRGTTFSMVAADEKLFATTLEGSVYCFGGREAKAVVHAVPTPPPCGSNAEAGAMLEKAGVREGFGVCLGLKDGRLLEALALQSKFRWIAVDADTRKVEAVRKALHAKGLYGERIAVCPADPLSFEFPPYLATLVVSEDLEAAGLEKGRAFAEKVFHPLRPYGGVACLAVPAAKKDGFSKAVAEANLAGARLDAAGEYVLLSRVGALPGTSNWTHQYGDAAKTCVSRDEQVKAPLGILWFGGPSHDGILPRHGHGPSEQIVDGRLFIEGPDLLRAVDVYTGRLVWEKKFPGVGLFYNNTAHQPGANALGSNYASAGDGVYVIHQKSIVKLNPATGEETGRFTFAAKAGDKDTADIGTIALWEDLLFVHARPLTFPASKGKIGMGENWDGTSSKTLAAFDRQTGTLCWSQDAVLGFLHNGTAIGAGKVFGIDALPPGVLKDMQKRKAKPSAAPRIMALEARTGKTVWSVEANVFGSWLGYSEEHDVLIQSGRNSRDMVSDEPDRRVVALRGKDGMLLWDKPIETAGPPMINGRTIYTQRGAYDLLTGEEQMREDPLTGLKTPFRFTRNYGCNSVIGSTHLMTFRSAAAAYFDLANDGGTANLGGFKSSCTSNLIVANGVLNAPDYTRTCVCSYQNQSSLALIHSADVEQWTFSDFLPVKGPVKRVGVNFGAPGDRRADDGTFWLDYPSVGGPSPALKIEVKPEGTVWFRKHSSRISGDGLPWVAASGGLGMASVRVSLSTDASASERSFTVRLYFVEPEEKGPGERIFDVSLQDRSVLQALDVVKEAGGPDRVLVKEFRGVKASSALALRLSPSAKTKDALPVLCGIEVLAE